MFLFKLSHLLSATNTHCTDQSDLLFIGLINLGERAVFELAYSQPNLGSSISQTYSFQVQVQFKR